MLRAALLLACLAVPPAQAAPAAGTPLPRARVVDAAAAALFASQGGRLEARALDEQVEPLLPPPGAVSVKARVAENTPLSRRMLVHVDVNVDAQHWRTMAVWFAVQAWRPVWVAREPVAAGQATSQGFFTVEQREITALSSPPWPAMQGLEGLRLRRAVDAGTVLTAAQVEFLPAVARNQPVRVQVNAGLVSLQAAGVALADARIGERVRVLNPASRESFAARVVADGLVVPEER